MLLPRKHLLLLLMEDIRNDGLHKHCSFGIKSTATTRINRRRSIYCAAADRRATKSRAVSVLLFSRIRILDRLSSWLPCPSHVATSDRRWLGFRDSSSP